MFGVSLWTKEHTSVHTSKQRKWKRHYGRSERKNTTMYRQKMQQETNECAQRQMLKLETLLRRFSSQNHNTETGEVKKNQRVSSSGQKRQQNKQLAQKQVLKVRRTLRRGTHKPQMRNRLLMMGRNQKLKTARPSISKKHRLMVHKTHWFTDK